MLASVAKLSANLGDYKTAMTIFEQVKIQKTHKNVVQKNYKNVVQKNYKNVFL